MASTNDNKGRERMSTPIMPTARGHRIAALGAVLALTVSGCGSGSDRPRAERSPAPNGSATDLGSVRVHYRYEETIAGQRSRIEWEVITGPANRRRYSVTGGFNADGPAIGTYYVYDGKALLTYEPDNVMPYRRTTHPEADQKPPGLIVARPGSAAFTGYCPDARRTGTRSVLGRTADVYTCDASQAQDGQLPATELQLDEATGLVLSAVAEDGTITVTDLVFNPPITADTFSTALPAGVEEFEPFYFRLPRVGGGKVDSTYYVGQPLLVVAGDADGIRAMLARLAPMTDKPILGLLIAIPPPDWNGSLLNPADRRSLAAQVSKQAGSFTVPVAIDFKGAVATPISGAAGIPLGGTRPTAIGLVRSDQGLAKVLTEKASDNELRSQIANLP
jgi:outer membrane lipoprotein-sorting protein